MPSESIFEQTYETIRKADLSDYGANEYPNESTEETKFLGDPTRAEPTLVLRLGYNNFPDDADTRIGDRRGGAYRESDLDAGSFRYGVNLSLLADANMNKSGDARARVGTDAIMKIAGWSLTGGATIGYDQDGTDFLHNRVITDITLFAQSGYVIAGKIEPTLRTEAGLWQPNSHDLYSLASVAAGLNVFLRGHDMKWANDFTVASHSIAEHDQGVGLTAFRFRSQLQLVF